MDNFAPKVIDDCYHIYSDGTRLAVLCDTEEDYVFIMNQIAITSLYCDVRILCQEVMRTHFHLIAKGAPDKIQKYKREIKRLITRRYNRDGLGDIVKDAIQIAVDPIKDDEELRRKIIYVFRNCTEAGFRLLPEEYPWGPGLVYYRQDKTTYRKVSELDYREQCRLFRTRVKLPQNWEFDAKGMLVPRSYFDTQYLHNEVFLSPRQFIAFLNVKKKDLIEMEAADARPFLEKQDEGKLLKEMEYESTRRFKKPIKQLSQADKIHLATYFWNERKTLSVKQLARLSRLNEAVLRAIVHVPANTSARNPDWPG